MKTLSFSFDIDGVFRYNHFYRILPSPSLYSVHLHDRYEILYFLKGDATYVIEDKMYKLRAGDVIITPPGKYHFIQMDSRADYERHNLLFEAEEFGIDVSLLPKEIDILHVESGSIISEIFKKLDYYLDTFEREHFPSIARLLVQELVYNISYNGGVSKGDDLSPIDPILSRAISYISDNLFTVTDIAEIADAIFVSPSYLFRMFKRVLFKTPKKYITEKRLLAAKRKLKEGRRAADVAAECGFSDYATFYRNYLAMFGKSPTQDQSAK